MRIVFMGTPEFAVPSLRKLAESRHTIVGVVTQPDRPKGRGLSLGSVPVTQEALKLGFTVIQPDDLTNRNFTQSLADLKGDCFAVVGFRILPEAVFQMPPKGTVNLHASLLPQYRGAAPIQWAVVRGETLTGVTTFFIRKKVDSGDIILQDKIAIGENETAGELHDRLAMLGADVLARTMDLIESDRVERVPQCGMVSLAPKLLPEHCKIDWGAPAVEIHNLIRGLSPKPGAFTMLKHERLKIFRSRLVDKMESNDSSPGTVVCCTRGGLTVRTGKGNLQILDVQLECKARMGISEFLCGKSIAEGIRLGEPGRR